MSPTETLVAELELWIQKTDSKKWIPILEKIKQDLHLK
jgi:hypothetical protein